MNKLPLLFAQLLSLSVCIPTHHNLPSPLGGRVWVRGMKLRFSHLPRNSTLLSSATTPLFLAFALALAITSPLTHAKLTVPAVFSDHMVLQREMNTPVWGTADPNEKITVTFAGQEKSTAADNKGNWRIEFAPLPASANPQTLTISGADSSLEIKDVLVGEVWVGSGQSNMAGGAGRYAANDKTLAALLENAPYPKIRLSLSKGAGQPSWSPATREAIEPFSALLFSFGQSLHQELDVPVGLIAGAVGGTPSGSWLSAEAFANDKQCQAAVAEFAKTYDLEKAREKFKTTLAAWEIRKEKLSAEGAKVPRKPNPPVAPGQHQRGTTVGNLYDRFIQPYIGFGIRGVLWDQGESGTAILGVDQVTLMAALINGWRDEWSQGDFPFVYIQKPSGGGCAWDPSDPITREAEAFVTPIPELKANDNGLYREHHINIRNYPNTWMSSASDTGPMVHPTNKWGYGNRAAQVALHAAYDKDVPAYGPSYRSHTVEDNKIRITFHDIGPGLAFKHHDALQGFAIAGDDKIFHWADATIDGDTTLVSSPEVPSPVSVRYAWARNHPWANLFSKNGLPALTFRTDNW
jgi:sialate O-acetylesterase